MRFRNILKDQAETINDLNVHIDCRCNDPRTIRGTALWPGRKDTLPKRDFFRGARHSTCDISYEINKQGLDQRLSRTETIKRGKI